MRIDAYNKISQIYQANSTKKIQSISSVKEKDKVEISRMGKEYQIAKAAVSNSSDIRSDKVNDIKQRMETGTYDVSGKDLADKLLEGLFDSSI